VKIIPRRKIFGKKLFERSVLSFNVGGKQIGPTEKVQLCLRLTERSIRDAANNGRN
jgi:hypothetical protein